MAEQDFFKEIAMTKHPSRTADREIAPAPLPDTIFQAGEEAAPELFADTEASFEDRREWFFAELDQMRERFRPFMRDLLPDLPETVKTYPLEDFAFRYLDRHEREIFSGSRKSGWEEVKIPDYRGPAGENGKWRGCYRCVFFSPEEGRELRAKGRRAVLAFQCVDYIARIYVNGCYVGSHEGFFAPFSFDITDFLEKENELLVICENDIPILGVGPVLDGDKIYAATGPGYDDPEEGWHHCPAGAGIFGKAALEIRPSLFVEDLFVRPLVSENGVEVRIGVRNYTDQVVENFILETALFPKNFVGEEAGRLRAEVACVGPGKNEYRYFIPMKDMRLWDTETPWLYGALTELKQGEETVSARRQTFGLKTFVSDETTEPKGKFFLNGKPAVLRGANEMGHLQQCVMRGDMDQLVDDILIAKLCHMNYYRVTQRPVQEEIYDYFDMLGMMHQCDLPLFGFLRRPQFSEAVRQVGEMEHLVRRHVSTVMVTFINEPMCIRQTEDPNDKYSKRYRLKGHRHLLRDELEAFFAAARKAVYVENPDRVVKNVEGDYDGPTAEGMPDFHCYTMWYTNHGEPIGRLMRGWLPPVKSGWMIGCGEYGAEGLDNRAVMEKYYPREWLAADSRGRWYPDKIVRAQTPSVQGDWYPEQNTMDDWIRESQIHQARATKLMTDAFRRRGDIMNQTAIHLLIDAWPSGWMKTLLDCDRQPKRAYFAYRDALEPLRVNLYTGMSCVYEGDTVPVEAWLLNDTGDTRRVAVHAAVFRENGTLIGAWSHEAEMPAAGAVCAGMIPARMPARTGARATAGEDSGTGELTGEGGACASAGNGISLAAEAGPEKIRITASIVENGVVLNRESLYLTVYPRSAKKLLVRAEGALAREVLRELAQRSAAKKEDERPDCLVSSDLSAEALERLEKHVREGGTGMLLLQEPGTEITVGVHRVFAKPHTELFFADAGEEWKQYPVSMLYNAKKGYIDSTLGCILETDMPGEEILFTYGKKLPDSGAKAHLPVVKRCRLGKGSLVLSALSLDGRVGANAGLDALLSRLMEERGEQSQTA